MLADTLTALLEWIAQNPHWAYLAVFLVAASESLIVVGLIVPGAMLMFGFGALVATGALELGPTLLWATVGAVVGDGASFWIGRHFHQRLRTIWPFNRHAALLNRGVDFFHHHGVKSVVLARFIGPVRPILPAVAGMLDMSPRRFLAANVASALVWAPAYTLPGVVFGAALGLAAEVAGRLAVLLVVLLSLLWFGLWLTRTVYRLLQPRAGYLLARTLHWSRHHPLMQPLTAAVLDPTHPEARGLAVLLLMLALTSALLAWLAGGWLAGLDLYLHAALQELRTPVADRVLVFIFGLGDHAVLLVVLAAGCVWLSVRGRFNAALHWLAAGVSALVLAQLLKLAAGTPRPPELVEALGLTTLPGGHTGLSIAVYGFLAVLVARELTQKRRWMPYICAALVVIPLAFARLYLGASTLSDVLAGTAMGLACVALLGIAYRRHPARPLGWPALTLVACAALLGAGSWHSERLFTAELERYASPGQMQALDADAWWSDTWQGLPMHRHDFRVRDRQMLNLQYAGDLASLVHALGAHQWRNATPLSAATALLWLSPRHSAATRPVLPQVHDGQHDTLRLLRVAPDGETIYILRLWQTRWRLAPDGKRLWVGTVTTLELHQRMRLFSYVVTGSADSTASVTLQHDLAAACDTVSRLRSAATSHVLLVRECRDE